MLIRKKVKCPVNKTSLGVTYLCVVLTCKSDTNEKLGLECVIVGEMQICFSLHLWATFRSFCIRSLCCRSDFTITDEAGAVTVLCLGDVFLPVLSNSTFRETKWCLLRGEMYWCISLICCWKLEREFPSSLLAFSLAGPCWQMLQSINLFLRVFLMSCCFDGLS